MRRKILLLEPLVESGLEVLQQSEEVQIVHAASDFNPEEIYGIIARGKIPVTKEMIDRMSNLKVISKCGTGLDTIATDHAATKHISIYNTPGINADSVAEHTLALILMLKRKINRATHEVRKGNWNYRAAYDGDEIRDKTLGVIGMGDIGQKVARLANCFGMVIQYWNRSNKNLEYRQITLDELFATSDVVSIHVALNDETRYLVDQSALDLMKSNAIIINTARADIVDEKALVEKLKVGELGAYAVDVPRNDFPDADHPLNQFENVLMTPHTASLTKRTFDEICKKAALNILEFIGDKD